MGEGGKCHYSCENCTGPDAKNCTSCWESLNGREDSPKRNLKEGSCVCESIPGYGFDNGTDHVCQKCHYTCDTCSGS